MPGPAPTHQPCFPAAFLDHARALVRRRAIPFQPRQRAQLACALAECPSLSHAEAAAYCRMQPDTVRKWRRRRAAGASPSTTGPAEGASPPFPPLDRAVIKALACELVHETDLP